VIPDAANPTIICHDPAPVVVDEAADEFLSGLLDEDFLPGLRRIGLKCFLPGPCWDRRRGQCFEYSETSVQLLERRSVAACWLGIRTLIASRQRAMICG
jgi:hypothetical protein